jgi:signal transduction histidine kinase
VLGWARLLMSKQLTTERAAQAVETIERNAASLARMIDDLLDVSRVTAGTLRLAPQPVDLVAVAESALDVVKPLAVHKHIQLRLRSGSGSVAPVTGDVDRLHQVIWNLLANAIKFTSEGGQVDVSVERVGLHMEVQVVDTGQGIAPEFLPHVFERFRQAHGTPSGRQGGLGLGLAIVRQLVDLHEGTVQAFSEGRWTWSDVHGAPADSPCRRSRTARIGARGATILGFCGLAGAASRRLAHPGRR